MKRIPLDIYDDIPKDMRKYIQHNGWNFNKKACEYAVNLMKKYNPSTDKLEKLEPYSKDQVDEMLQNHGITLDNNVGYNYVFVANMAKADYFKSSLEDEHHLALFVKDYIDDPDASSETAFRRWYITMMGNGEIVDWSDII